MLLIIICITCIIFCIRRSELENNLYYSDADKVTELNNVNKKLSGFWFVTGINYIYRRSGGVEQEITLMRRDLNINYGANSDEKHDLSSFQK